MDEVNSLLENRICSKRSSAAVQPAAPATPATPAAAPATPVAAPAAPAASSAEPVAEEQKESKKDEIINRLKKKFRIRNVMVSAAGKNMTVVVFARAFGYIPLRFEFTGMLQPADENRALNFYTERGRIGYLPLPGNFYDRYVLKKFAPAFGNPELERALKRATLIRMNDDKLHFGFTKPKETEEKK